MDKVELIRLKRNIYYDVQEMLSNYGLDRDERFAQNIAENIAKKYLEKRGIEING